MKTFITRGEWTSRECPIAAADQSALLSAESEYEGARVLDGFSNATLFSLIPFVGLLLWENCIGFFAARSEA
jgi:hypothetical protein